MKGKLLRVLILLLACISYSECRKANKNKIGGRSTIVPIGEACYQKWQVCAEGTSCWHSACNCDDLEDGTIMSIVKLKKDGIYTGLWECRRIAGEKCTKSSQCYPGVSCRKGKCTCPKTPGFVCIKTKQFSKIVVD